MSEKRPSTPVETVSLADRKARAAAMELIGAAQRAAEARQRVAERRLPSSPTTGVRRTTKKGMPLELARARNLAGRAR